MARVLVLNASYEPLSVVAERRAIILMLNQKASLVVGKDEVWRSENDHFEVPSVVRLRRYVKVPYRRTAPVTRRAVFGRDGHRCQYCGGPAESLDHVLPRSKGGDHTWENVVACCRPCNIRKGDRLPKEAGFALTTKPRPPRRHAWIYASTGYDVDPAWHPYLGAA
ncbi:MAG: HNH endonuclease [Acidimicrobiia bacterium]